MNKSKNINLSTLLVVFVFVAILYSCGDPGKNDPGSEYMPDMGHSIAYEANHYDYYARNTWGSEEDYHKMAQPRKPVNGTIPRGYAGHVAVGENDVAVPANGSVPYYYADTEEERTRAMTEITTNPFPITEDGLNRAKDLYNVNCGICHGEKADGNGYLVAEENPNVKYPAQPAIFTTDEFVAASEGRYYHAIMHGKNVMGGYADKLSYEERWQVIHYIRALQAKDRKLVYSETENTLNLVGVPGASIEKKPHMHAAKIEVPMLGAHGHDTKDSHESHDAHGDHGHDDAHEGDHSGDDGHGHDH